MNVLVRSKRGERTRRTRQGPSHHVEGHLSVVTRTPAPEPAETRRGAEQRSADQRPGDVLLPVRLRVRSPGVDLGALPALRRHAGLVTGRALRHLGRRATVADGDGGCPCSPDTGRRDPRRRRRRAPQRSRSQPRASMGSRRRTERVDRLKQIRMVVVAVACSWARCRCRPPRWPRAPFPPASSICTSRAGPYKITPGANLILLDTNQVPKPTEDGYMVRLAPNLHYAKPDGNCCGAIPRVDVIHLHHGVWLSNGADGAGEGNGTPAGFYPVHGRGRGEDDLPASQGLRVSDRRQGLLGPQLHDPQPDLAAQPRSTSPTTSTSSRPTRPRRRESSPSTRSGWTSSPTTSIPCSTSTATAAVTACSPSRTWRKTRTARARRCNMFTVDHPGTLIGTAGHVHPGGLYDELDAIRPDAHPQPRRAPRAPSPTRCGCSAPTPITGTSAGPISWDMAMKATAPDWRARVNAGDQLRISTTYETTPRVLVRVDGDHGRVGGVGRHQRRRPVRPQARPERPRDPRPPGRERPPRRRASRSASTSRSSRRASRTRS